MAEENINEVPAVNTDVPKPKEEVKPTPIEAATALADRIDAGNKLALEITERNEKLHAEQMLGGSSDAGQAPEAPVDPEQVIKDRCNKQLEGIGLKI